uniref:Proline rich Gla (G-carboxyglutamic acid) 1 n=1 Tax=Xenopus tropicalis TaxID=8364 RepID=A0A6I8S6X6_XENTR
DPLAGQHGAPPVFLTEDKANSVLKRSPRANSFFEEIKQGNIERECKEELCTYEEAREAFENDEKTNEFWKEYTQGQQGDLNAGNNWYPFYLAFPLIIVFFIILLVILLVWKCVFKKKARRQTAYAPRGIRENATEVAIDPDGFGISPQHGTVLYPMEVAFDRGRLHSGYEYDVHSDTLSAGLSNCDPPPSYEEATGERGVRVNEPPPNPTDPPPEYDEIVTSAAANTVPHGATSTK